MALLVPEFGRVRGIVLRLLTGRLGALGLHSAHCRAGIRFSVKLFLLPQCAFNTSYDESLSEPLREPASAASWRGCSIINNGVLNPSTLSAAFLIITLLMAI